jgi:DNA-binding transcriptional LysR family regulator
MDQLTSMSIFVHVAEHRTFAAAAQAFDMSSTMVANHVRSLEARLGGRLLETTTRRQTLTELGAAYLERCRDAIASVKAADQVAEFLHGEPRGLLRVSAPTTWGGYRLAPVMAEYLGMHPKVEARLILADRAVDLAEEGFDCAIRSGRLTDDRLVARPLRRSRMALVASPAYLERHGTPGQPSDLANHTLLAFTEWRTTQWRFTRGEESVLVPIHARLSISNGQALVNATLSGAGITAQPEALVEQGVAAGRLQRVLPEWQLPSREMHIVRLPDARPSAKVRAFVDLVLARLGPGTR